MTSPNSVDNPSPSASSLFLPLGREASRTSVTADRENLTEVLNQIHNAAYQSDSLTVFNEFSNLPPTTAVGESKGSSNDAAAGLSGFYNRFRASVGGVREIVGGSGRPTGSTETSPTIKSPSAERLSLGGDGDGQISHSASVSGSKINSPVLETWPTPLESSSQGTAPKGTKLPPNSPNVSSKASTLSTPLVKSPVASMPKTANPTVSEVTVSAVKDENPGVRHHGVGSSSVQSSERENQDGTDPSPRSSFSQASVAPGSHRSYSPVLTAKSLNNTYRDGQNGSETHQRQRSRGEISEHDWVSQPSSATSDRHPSLETDASLSTSSHKRTPGESVNESIQPPSQKSFFTTSSNSLTNAETPMTTSGNSSLTRTSVDESNYTGGRSSINSATTGVQTSVSGGDLSTPASSRPSLEKPRGKLTPKVSQSRLPGFMMSRASSSETTTTQISAVTDVSKQPIYRTSRPPRPNTDAQNKAFSQLRSKLLSREFWMRDENAKDCFLCQEPFTTFRRKHHCRTCGQIFDSKCTVLIPGIQFGQSGSIRVCKPCEAMISAHDDDSSDLSDSEQSPVIVNHRYPELTYTQTRSQTDDDDAASIRSQSFDQVLKTPTMAIPATRRTADGNNRRSAVLEIEADRPLARPTSSRSLRSSMGGRTHSMGHKRHHSRQQYIRSFKSYHEDRAPFQRRPLEDTIQGTRLPAFHRDSIIDPDLAQYLSDDASSGDEQQNLLSVVSDGSGSKAGTEHERPGFAGFLAAVKKGRSRIGDRSVVSGVHHNRDLDDGSVSSSRAVNLPSKPRRRNLSVASSIQQRPPTRAIKDNALVVHEHSPKRTSVYPTVASDKATKMTRSSSMRGASAPAIELNRASLEHVRKLLRQLLKDHEVPNGHGWEAALLPILLKATDEVDPDVQGGDDMDIRHYVKLKKIPGGRPGDTSYVSGLVFTKNLALKSMPRSISQPKILIITFALEYARHQQHFMSLEPVIRQEREFLENLVSRIAAFRPNLLLVEKNISGLALDLLDKANIATAYNVKPSVLEAVSRCTQTRIVTSMDKLVTTPQHTGQCGSFDLKTYVHNGRKKTYMYISGCPKELGCTIVLRGGENETLIKIKRITEFMVYVVYNLKLETYLVRDEFAQVPVSSDSSLQLENSTGSTSTTSKWTLNSENTFDSVGSSRSEILSNDQNGTPDGIVSSPTDIEVPDDIPMPTYYEDMVHENENKILSSSPFVKFEPPYLLMRARQLERRLAYLKRLRDRVQFNDQPDDEKNKSEKFMLITPDMVRKSPQGASSKLKEVLHAVHDAEYDRALHTYQTQKRQWEAYLSGNANLFDPYAHQNIVVLYSLVCTTTSIPCSGPDIFALDFYNEHESDNRIFEADCTLGQYVEDLCLEANTTCTANGCDRKMFEHHRQYVHGEAQISIFVQPYPSKLRGLQDSILMWSCCKICGNETQVMPMSESTWRYSFGKYLELSFWSRKIRARAGVCPHDIHRDHLRYFGFKDMALRIHHDPITLLDIIVPRSRVTWKVDNDLKLRNEIYEKSEHRITKFMSSVKARLKSINAESVMPEKIEDCKKEIEILMKRANEEQTRLIRQLQEKYMNSRYWEVIPLNEALRSVQEQVVEWDTTFANFEKNFFPSEKDIRRLAALQLKKIFLDKDASTTSLTSAEETAASQGDSGTDEANETPDKPRPLRRMTLSPEKAKNVLASVVEEHSGRFGKDGQLPELAEVDKDGPDISQEAADPQQTQNDAANQPAVQHLDLAISPVLSAVPNGPPDQKLASTAVEMGEEVSDQTDLIDEPLDLENRPLAKRSETTDAVERRKDSELVGPSTPIRSSIPRPTEGRGRRGDQPKSPPLFRTYSQPVRSPREKVSGSGTPPTFKTGLRVPNGKVSEALANPGFDTKSKVGEKKLSDRFVINTLKNVKPAPGQSLIPRSVPIKNSKRVSSLAKHFEQLSREFDKERQRDRQQRAAKSKHSRAYPMASSKPIVEIYRNVREAVEEKEPSGESEEPSSSQTTNSLDSSQHSRDLSRTDTTISKESAGETETEVVDDAVADEKAPQTALEGDEVQSDEERSLDHLIDSPEELAKLSSVEVLELKELPKYERSTLVKMLTNFWAERSASGWQPLDYPLRVSDHVFADCDIIVREDEPSSLIAFALDSEDYQTKLASIQEKYEKLDAEPTGPDSDATKSVESRLEHALLRPTGTHLKYQFQEGQAKMLCKVFYAEQFDALRRKCGVADRIVESLSRCAKWDSKGGKTKSLFLKTLDDRFVLKSLSTIETQAFLKFAPAYFQIMSEALFHELPSVIAKMFGFYQVIIKNPATGVEFNWFLLVMENLFYDRVPTRIFDLKGSMRNRKVQSTGERDEVLLDENMVDFIYETPLFTREHSKKLLSQSVWNDTLFLGRQNVMDYSLMIAIDEIRRELVVGIIDCIRTYTWDKKLESWIKDRGFAGGGKNRPTVTSPKEYKSRFREAMARYVLQAPNCWHQFGSTHMDQTRRIEHHLQHMSPPAERENEANEALM